MHALRESRSETHRNRMARNNSRRPVVLGLGHCQCANSRQRTSRWRAEPYQIERAGLLSARAVRRGLRELGWLPGQNVIIEYRYAEGDIARLPALAEELVRLPVAVIVARTPQGIRAAQAATSAVPIVMAASNDPVQQGFVAKLARPGGNTTGLAIT